ncbi:hypothetical protein AYL99_07167 [Fonsecaea erecta]|uniref:Uncharacterized protein n=1 Tax=Fonsecaea erecta TaxID=1367422 RepID=A0A178ZE75_9EURO|nr:hypothetical protein AYL99_07167 [Fonsecaea erecta]OAP58077.1 hypothetical protein AYL99_07167 [Fonsecaea erecta]
MASEIVNGDIFTLADIDQHYSPGLDARRLNSASRINTERSNSSTEMPRDGFGHFENSSRAQPTRPPHLRRRITIGGSAQRVKGDEHSTWPLDARNRPAIRPAGDSGLLSVKSHYPPTSWRPTPSTHASISDVEENGMSEGSSSGDMDGGYTKSDAAVSLGKLCLNPTFSTSTRTSNPVRGPQSSSNQTSPARSNSRHRYSITFSRSAASANSETLQNRVTRASASSRRASSGPATLPDPDTAYAHTYYYTVCAHTSPPMSRPLNVQPTPVPYRKGLLAYPPFHLRAYSADPAIPPPTIYVLEGSCSHCDITVRRDAESRVLDRYTHQLENLYIQLNLLQKDIAIESCNVSLPARSDNAITTFSFPSTLELKPEATQAILEIEDRLDQLIRKRDQEVKQIWKGYTARWGPATVGIHRENKSRGRSRPGTADTRGSVSQDTAGSTTTSFGVPSDDRSPGRTHTMTTLSTHPTMPPSRLSRNRSYDTRPRANSVGGPQERYSHGTYGVSVDSSVDGIRGRGRMVVDWIRPGQQESRGRSIVQATSRPSSRHVPNASR